MDVLRILSENPSQARNPSWLLTLLTKKINFLGEQLKTTLDNDLAFESIALMRVENFRQMDVSLGEPA